MHEWQCLTIPTKMSPKHVLQMTFLPKTHTPPHIHMLLRDLARHCFSWLCVYMAKWPCQIDREGRTPTSQYLSKGIEVVIQNRYLHSLLHCKTIHKGQDIVTTSMSVNRWMGKENVVYIHKTMLFSPKREGYPAICSTAWVNLEAIMLNAISRHREIPHRLTYT